MKFKMKKVISFILVMLILLSNSPISLSMDKDFFDNRIKDSNSINRINTQDIKEDYSDSEGSINSKSGLLEKISSGISKEESKEVREKKLILKFEKLINDKSGESALSQKEALELRDKLDIKDYGENSPEYIDVSKIEVRDG